MVEIENNKQEQLPFKKIYAAYIIFMLAQVFLTISLASYGSNFKFLPKWLDNLAVFAILSYIFYIISLFFLRKLAKQFYYSLITVILLLVTTLTRDICRTSSEALYLAWGKGLEFTITLLEVMFFAYFFQGTFLIMKQHKHEEGAQKTKGALIAFIVIFILNILASFISKMPVVINHLVANRVSLYSCWLLQFVFYL